MFKSTIEGLLTELQTLYATIGEATFITADITTFAGGNLYNAVVACLQTVVQPIAYAVFGLFCLMEMVRITTRVEGAGGGTSMGAEQIIRFLIKAAIFKVVIDHSLDIMTAIIGFVQGLGTQISAKLPSASGNLIFDNIDTSNLTIGEQIGTLIKLLPVYLGVWVLRAIATVITVGRIIEIYIYVAVAPLPLATLGSEDLGSVGKNFLKSFIAVCLSGVFMLLVISFYPYLANATLNGFGIFGGLFCSILLVLALARCGSWAKSICNAM